MKIYYDSIHKHFFAFFPRTGSSLFNYIYEHSPHIEEMDVVQMFEILESKPLTPIYITIRDPKVRFRGGLHTTSVNTSNLVPDHDHLGQAAEFCKSLRTLTTYSPMCVTNGTSVLLGAVPFHLYDIHLAHILWKPLLLISYGYNVQLVPLRNYTECLMNFYGEHTDTIQSYHRPDSDKVPDHKTSGLLWHAYHQVMLDPGYGSLVGLTWDDWIQPECDVYKFLDQPGEKTPEEATEVITRLIENGLYFCDLLSPTSNYLEHMLSILYHKHGVYHDLWVHRQKAYRHLIGKIPVPDSASYPKEFPGLDKQ